jgi:glyoxylase-like metal-dependent hydrolase (beta-lactamase superfamily II)
VLPLSKHLLAVEGNVALYSVELGTFALDGGGMFGSVPKVIWEESFPPSPRNTFKMVTRGILFENQISQYRLLVEVGMGPLHNWSKKEQEIYEITPFDHSLLGQIKAIVLTHLHFDHANGLYDQVSETPTFPGAKIFLQEANLKNAQKPHIKERRSYRKEILDALSQYDMKLINGEVRLPIPEIEPFTVRVIPSDGHTIGLQALIIESGKRSFLYPSDLIPTHLHLKPPYSLGYDQHAALAIDEKLALLARVPKDTEIIFVHDLEKVSTVI